MKKTFLPFILFIICNVCLSQIPDTDTLNKYNEQKNKHGYWLIYLTDKLCITENKNDAYYYTILYYDNGYSADGFFCNVVCKTRSMSASFIAPQTAAVKGTPVLLNGNFKTFNKQGNIILNETFINGVPTIVEDYSYDKNGLYKSKIIYDCTKRFNNQPCSFYVQIIVDEKIKSKYYYGKNNKGKWVKITD